MDNLDNLDLLFSFTDYEWTMYSIHRLNQSEGQSEYLRQEVIKQISLEHQFRTAINKVIADNEIIDDDVIIIDNEIIDITDIINFLDTY